MTISHTASHHGLTGGAAPGGSTMQSTGYSTSSTTNITNATGFKVYGSVFKVDARYQFLNPLGKGSYGIVW